MQQNRQLRFRQIHLDFHTSPDIEKIGCRFDRKQWQKTLTDARVNSVTAFALCHHGYSYYDTSVGTKHPNLSFNLLREQFEACKEIDINVPIYLTAGSNWLQGVKHPEWVEIDNNGKTAEPFYAGFRKMCFNSPYTDYLCRNIEEVVTLFPDCDGIFLDIILQGECCCRWCMESMLRNGLDPQNSFDRKKNARATLEKYFRATTAAAKSLNTEMPVFHNTGNFSPEWKDTLSYYDHLELESLPTGGWGYDHFPMQMKYSANSGKEILGMTGRFHTTWGEFGGYKHPDALRYECMAMMATGAKCSVGDQLHPCGEPDSTTYRIVGETFREIESKEQWCTNVRNVADIGLLCTEGLRHDQTQDNAADIGAARLLFEGHFLFDIIDEDVDFSKFKLLVLPDIVLISEKLKNKIDAYLDNGGKLLLSGQSGIDANTEEFIWDTGAVLKGESEFQPDYFLPAEDFSPEFLDSPAVMYYRSQRIEVTDGKSCGKIYDPYFNRNFQHFCSHQHTPPTLEDSGYDCGVVKGGVMYLAHPVFTNYRWYGASISREYLTRCIKFMLGDKVGLETNLPVQARVNFVEQPEENRYILHLLYANKILRGGENGPLPENTRSSKAVEVIEGLEELHDIDVSVFLEKDIRKINLEPQGMELPFCKINGRLNFRLDKFKCHQMIVFDVSQV